MKQAVPLSPSPAVLFSGYHPIEVTHEDFRRTVGKSSSRDEEDEDIDKTKSCLSPPKSMTKRIGNMLMTPHRKKKSESHHHGRRVESSSQCGESSIMSGVSNQGQQSVANKTVDSQVTVKVSNKQQISSSSLLLQNNGGATGGSGSASLGPSANKLKQSKTWKTLKRLVKGNTSQKYSSSSYHTELISQRKHSSSYDGAQAILGCSGRLSSSSLLNSAYPIRKRIQSEEGIRRDKVLHGKGASTSQRNNVSFSGISSSPSYRNGSQKMIDHAIRGRLDGVDILSLGPACRSSLPPLSEKNRAKKSSSPHLFAFAHKESDQFANDSSEYTDTASGRTFDPLRVCFTDIPSTASPADLVSDMIWTSAGKDQPEIILEGFNPGGSDRWTVRIMSEEQLSSSDSHQSHNIDSQCPPTLQSTTDDDESTAISSHATEDGSTNLAPNILWYNLWGQQNTPPIPTHMKTAIGTKTVIADEEDDMLHSASSDEDQILQFAASCNVPIDLDEDAFIIDSPDHLQSVHELAMVPLQSRRFESAISVFQKLLRGLESADKFEHLIGSTHHNIGMIQLCQGHYMDALSSFQKAVHARKQCLPSNHPDIAISLQREGVAHFALSAMNEAVECFEGALEFFPDEDATRAKVLNNIGVAQYQLEAHAKSLKSFTSALEIQRPWLEGPVWRECMVFDASITLANMGKVNVRKGDYDLAYFVFEEACLLQTSSFRKDHDIVLISLDNMARVHAKNGNQAEALRIFTSLSRSQVARFGPDNEACIETFGMKGVAHFKLLEFEEALECMNRVATWQAKNLVPSHPAVREVKENIKQIKRCIQGEEPMWV